MLPLRIAAIAASLIALTVSAQARPHKAHHKTHHKIQYSQIHRQQAQSWIITCNQQGCSDRVTDTVPASNKRASKARIETVRGGESYLTHPAGCPRVAFCACGASVEVFGRSIRALWPARAWYRFPRAAPAYKTVAVSSHHAFVLISHVEGDNWLVHDYNSGGHLSREHVVSIRGWTIVRPVERYSMN